MSNAADDPGHRPPPPRQGDPHPYQGDPQPHLGDPQPHPGGPPYGGYAPPPPNQPPPPAAWQGPPPGYGPPAPYPGPPARPARPAGKGFLGALFDMSFDHMVTIKVVRAAYALSIAAYTGIALLMLYEAWGFSVWNKFLEWITILATPVVWLTGILTTRLALEFVINQFKISEHLKVIRDQNEPR
ncbi:DUF4282 domain-containing protein [Actinoallomurus spadix]|uniref:DUF4282 domain-containing protein n=2 Tax=Actinoallomurus spadix TaxID=79912 RepID=A0ABN0X7U3_9ACTN|nr:DUF4282 domain-containing protein [Actinoallomurus spadix]